MKKTMSPRADSFVSVHTTRTNDPDGRFLFFHHPGLHIAGMRSQQPVRILMNIKRVLHIPRRMILFRTRLIGCLVPSGIGFPGKDQSVWLTDDPALLRERLTDDPASLRELTVSFASSYLDSARSLNSFNICPNSFFLSADTFFISWKRFFTIPLVPRKRMRYASAASAPLISVPMISFR